MTSDPDPSLPAIESHAARRERLHELFSERRWRRPLPLADISEVFEYCDELHAALTAEREARSILATEFSQLSDSFIAEQNAHAAERESHERTTALVAHYGEQLAGLEKEREAHEKTRALAKKFADAEGFAVAGGIEAGARELQVAQERDALAARLRAMEENGATVADQYERLEAKMREVAGERDALAARVARLREGEPLMPRARVALRVGSGGVTRERWAEDILNTDAEAEKET